MAHRATYCLVLDASTNHLKQCINHPGWFGNVHPVTVQYNRAYTIRVELSGNTFDVYLDGVHVFTTSQTFYQSGRFGVLVTDGEARFDDLVAWRLP
jgi:hypothetical protein